MLTGYFYDTAGETFARGATCGWTYYEQLTDAYVEAAKAAGAPIWLQFAENGYPRDWNERLDMRSSMLECAGLLAGSVSRDYWTRARDVLEQRGLLPQIKLVGQFEEIMTYARGGWFDTWPELRGLGTRHKMDLVCSGWMAQTNVLKQVFGPDVQTIAVDYDWNAKWNPKYPREYLPAPEVDVLAIDRYVIPQRPVSPYRLEETVFYHWDKAREQYPHLRIVVCPAFREAAEDTWFPHMPTRDQLTWMVEAAKARQMTALYWFLWGNEGQGGLRDHEEERAHVAALCHPIGAAS